jgi:hypothetical protein
MSVYCADSSCKYSSVKNRCTAKQVVLSWHSVMTVWNGRRVFLQCRSYEMSDEAKRMFEAIRKAEEAERCLDQ